jgi:hypothetical protein
MEHQPSLETQQRGDVSQSHSPHAHQPVSKKLWVKPDRKKLTEEELEQKRREMMDNAKWREKERETNIARYKAQDEKEKKCNKEYSGDFLRYASSYMTSSYNCGKEYKYSVK